MTGVAALYLTGSQLITLEHWLLPIASDLSRNGRGREAERQLAQIRALRREIELARRGLEHLLSAEAVDV